MTPLEMLKYINLPSLESYTALHFGAYRGNIMICDLLIKNGANIDQKNNNGMNSLHLAA